MYMFMICDGLLADKNQRQVNVILQHLDVYIEYTCFCV